jgi:hypothetical protein
VHIRPGSDTYGIDIGVGDDISTAGGDTGNTEFIGDPLSGFDGTVRDNIDRNVGLLPKTRDMPRPGIPTRADQPYAQSFISHPLNSPNFSMNAVVLKPGYSHVAQWKTKTTMFID